MIWLASIAASMFGWGRSILKWLARLPWYVMTIAALCAVCVILWTGWGKSADKWKAERAAHGITRGSIKILAERIVFQNRAVDAMAKESKKRSQAGKDALQARVMDKVASKVLIERLSRPEPITGRCVTPAYVMESGI